MGWECDQGHKTKEKFGALRQNASHRVLPNNGDRRTGYFPGNEAAPYLHLRKVLGKQGAQDLCIHTEKKKSKGKNRKQERQRQSGKIRFEMASDRKLAR